MLPHPGACLMRFLILLLLAFLVTLATPVNAAWQDRIQQMVDTGDISGLTTLATEDPEAAGAVALALLEKANSALASDPARAAQLFDAATSFTAGLDAAGAAQAAGYIQNFVDAAGSASFPTEVAAQIFSTALVISSQPSIISVAPSLHSTVLVATTTFTQRNPDVKIESSEPALLAEQPAPPTLSTQGAQIPSAE